MSPPASIFKAYDIRDTASSTLTLDFARNLSRAFRTEALLRGEATVAVGRDGRLIGPVLAEALMQGLQEAGIAVIDVGMVTIPCCALRPAPGAAAASRSLAGITRATTTVSRWCWPGRLFLETTPEPAP